MSCPSMVAEAQALVQKAKTAKTPQELRKIEDELNKLGLCPDVKAHILEHINIAAGAYVR